MKTFKYVNIDEFGNNYYTEEADKFGKRIFEVIHEVKDKYSKMFGYSINTEQIPGESAASKLLLKDKQIFKWLVVDDVPLYGNQFLPLARKATLQERVRVAALFDSYCNGGSILHVNCDAPFASFQQAWDMLNYISDKGVTYFAFTGKISACDNNHGFYGNVCPECGSPKTCEYARIVGFFQKVNNWSAERKKEYSKREWEPLNEFIVEK